MPVKFPGTIAVRFEGRNAPPPQPPAPSLVTPLAFDYSNQHTQYRVTSCPRQKSKSCLSHILISHLYIQPFTKPCQAYFLSVPQIGPTFSIPPASALFSLGLPRGLLLP